MNLSILSSRLANSGATDPDSLHGLLCPCEGTETPETLARRLTLSAERMSLLLDRARAGDAGRVPPAHMVVADEKAPSLPGLFSRPWQRALIAGMLKPDGIVTVEVQSLIDGTGHNASSAVAMAALRGNLKVMGIAIESAPVEVPGAPRCNRYRIVGNSAWRMQKIVANGWRL